MSQYIVAHDVGTSGDKAVLVDVDGRVCGRVVEPYRAFYPKPGWAEQEPEDWWRAVTRGTRALLETTGVSPRDVLCITFSTQMINIVPLDASGKVLRRAIIWMDNRAGEQAEKIMKKFGGAGLFAMIAGATLSGKDGLPKLLWLKEKEPQVYNAMSRFVDVAGYLFYRSTGNIAMEWSGASVFGIDLRKKVWLSSLFKYIGLDPAKFPPLVRSVDKVGVLTAAAASEYGLPEGTPVIAGAGDAPCALIGSGAVGEGDGHVCLGTSGWVGVTTERTPTGKCGVATIQSADPDKAFLIAETEAAGACLQWLAEEVYKKEKTELGVPEVYAFMDREVAEVPPGSNCLLFTPWIYGERAPVDDCYVRAAFFNLSGEHTRRDMLRAVYEGVAYNIRWLVEIVEKRFEFPLPVLRVIGGGARSKPWMQVLADVTGRRVEAVSNAQEAGAVGAALVAGVGLGIYPDFASLKKVVRVDSVFQPQTENREVYNALFRAYQQVYHNLRGFYRKLNRDRFNKSI